MGVICVFSCRNKNIQYKKIVMKFYRVTVGSKRLQIKFIDVGEVVADDDVREVYEDSDRMEYTHDVA